MKHGSRNWCQLIVDFNMVICKNTNAQDLPHYVSGAENSSALLMHFGDHEEMRLDVDSYNMLWSFIFSCFYLIVTHSNFLLGIENSIILILNTGWFHKFFASMLCIEIL